MPTSGQQIRRSSAIRAFTIAAALAVVSLLLCLVLYAWLGVAVPCLQFFPAILLGARYGGRASGILATMLSTLAVMFFFLASIGSFPVMAIADVVSVPLFIMVGVAISEISESLRVGPGDPHRLLPPIWNLLSNAVKFTPANGSVRVAVPPEPRHITVTVRDTGEGIDRTILSCIFDRFRQADSTTRRAVEDIRARERGAAMAPVPIAAVTALQQGLLTHVAKPVDIRALLSTIRALMTQWGTTILPVLICAMGAAPVCAQEQTLAAQDLKRLSIEELTQLDITTASKRTEPLARTAAAVSVIRGEDIRRAGVTSLVDALRLVDGLAVARADASTWAVSARGFNITTANKLLVLIDGRTVYSPLFAGTFWSVQDVPLANIDRIEVTRGPGGTLWGANAVNGVVNVITKSASDTRGGQLLLAAGNEERAIATAQYGGSRANLDYRVYGKFRYRDANVLAGGVDANDPFKFAQAGMRVESKGQGRDVWFVQGDAYVGREGLFDRPDTHVDGGNIMGRWTRRFSPDAELRAQVYYDHVYRRVFQQLRDVRDTVDVDLQQRIAFANRHDLLFGGTVRVSRGDDTGNAAFFFDPPTAVTTIGGIFVQDEITIVPRRLVGIAGVKVERNAFTGLESQPNLRIRWTPTSTQTLWAAVSRAVRLPTRFDTDLRFTNPMTGAITLRGGRDFESEKLVAYEGGYRRQWRDRLSVDVAAYSNVYGDLRSEEFPAAAGQPIVLRNLLNARTAGVEVTAIASVLRAWRLHASYAYIHERFTLDPGSRDLTRGVFEYNDPSHMATLRSNMDLPHGFELDAAVRYVDRLPHPVVPAYAEMDARVGWRPAAAWDVSLVGQNLLHGHHREFQLSTPFRAEFERGFYVRTTWRF